ncbi:MAG: DinB family protein [Terracidiphilus sp.]
MSTLFPSLFRHQAWADAALLSAVRSRPESLADASLLKTLHHVVMVQRFFLSRFQGRDFDMARETQPPADFAALVALFRSTHPEELAFVDGLTEADLERRFDLSFLQSQPTVAEGLIQVAMHSQNHRGQCLTRLRELDAKPPTLDFILWAKDCPEPAWPEE